MGGEPLRGIFFWRSQTSKIRSLDTEPFIFYLSENPKLGQSKKSQWSHSQINSEKDAKFMSLNNIVQCHCIFLRDVSIIMWVWRQNCWIWGERLNGKERSTVNLREVYISVKYCLVGDSWLKNRDSLLAIEITTNGKFWTCGKLARIDGTHAIFHLI